MKKGFMMIEMCLVIFGLLLLVNVIGIIFKNSSQISFTYDYLKISNSCDIQCAINKPIP